MSLLALAVPAQVQAQVGFASGAAHVTLIARASPGVSLGQVTPARETARHGNVREQTVTLRLSANTGYRLMVLSTAAVSSEAGSAARLWVRAESGRFEEIRPGGAVAVVRGGYAVVGRESEVTFRSEVSESAEKPRIIPVRYEVRINPTI